MASAHVQRNHGVAPETFLLDQEQQSSLPADSVVALQQVDNRQCLSSCANDGQDQANAPNADRDQQ